MLRFERHLAVTSQVIEMGGPQLGRVVGIDIGDPHAHKLVPLITEPLARRVIDSQDVAAGRDSEHRLGSHVDRELRQLQGMGCPFCLVTTDG